MGEYLEDALEALADSTMWISDNMAENPDAVLAGATPYLRLFGLTAGGHYLARGALDASRSGDEELQRHIVLARFFATHHLTEAPGLGEVVMGGGDMLAPSSSQLFAA